MIYCCGCAPDTHQSWINSRSYILQVLLGRLMNYLRFRVDNGRNSSEQSTEVDNGCTESCLLVSVETMYVAHRWVGNW